MMRCGEKEKYRTVVYIFSDQPVAHSNISDQGQIKESRYVPQTGQPLQSLVNKDNRPKLTGI